MSPHNYITVVGSCFLGHRDEEYKSVAYENPLLEVIRSERMCAH